MHDCIPHHLFATHNVLVKLANPKEVNGIEYCLSIWFWFISPFGISERISYISDFLGSDWISRVDNFALSTDRDLTLEDEAVLELIRPNTYPAYCTDVTHFMIGAPGGKFSIRLRLLQKVVDSISNSLVTQSSVEPYG